MCPSVCLFMPLLVGCPRHLIFLLIGWPMKMMMMMMMTITKTTTTKTTKNTTTQINTKTFFWNWCFIRKRMRGLLYAWFFLFLIAWTNSYQTDEEIRRIKYLWIHSIEHNLHLSISFLNWAYIQTFKTMHYEAKANVIIFLKNLFLLNLSPKCCQKISHMKGNCCLLVFFGFCLTRMSKRRKILSSFLKPLR